MNDLAIYDDVSNGLQGVKDLLYGILTSGSNGSKDTSVTQQMGVQLSNTVKKDGVTIVQLQSVVNEQVMISVVDALKAIDSLQVRALPKIHSAEVALLPPSEDIQDAELIEQTTEYKLIQEHIEKGTELEEFVTALKTGYVSAALDLYPTKKAAADHLGLTPSYFGNLCRKLKLDEQKDTKSQD